MVGWSGSCWRLDDSRRNGEIPQASPTPRRLVRKGRCPTDNVSISAGNKRCSVTYIRRCSSQKEALTRAISTAFGIVVWEVISRELPWAKKARPRHIDRGVEGASAFVPRRRSTRERAGTDDVGIMFGPSAT